MDPSSNAFRKDVAAEAGDGDSKAGFAPTSYETESFLSTSLRVKVRLHGSAYVLPDGATSLQQQAWGQGIWVSALSDRIAL